MITVESVTRTFGGFTAVDDGLRSAVFCRGCVPAGPVIDLECGVCGDGPLLVSDVDEDIVGEDVVGVALLVDVGVRGWLIGQGWTLDPALVCQRMAGSAAHRGAIVAETRGVRT
jgi:hypothetical protein